MPAFYVEVPDIDTAVIVHDALAAYDVFQYEQKVEPDFCNAGGIQRKSPEDGEWEDIDEDEFAA